MDKRVTWSDSLKGLAIFYVTIGHLACNFLIEKHIYSFHMCLFFFISGYLYNNSKHSADVSSYIHKKIRTVLMPFICWNILSELIYIFFNGYDINVLKRLFLIDGCITWNAPIWFLWVLFLTQCLYAIIKSRLPHCNFICYVLSIVAGVLFAAHKTTFLLNLIPVSLLFYALGNQYNNIYDKISGIMRNKYIITICLLVCSAINILFGVFLNIRVSYTGANFGNYIYFVIAATAGVILYIILFQCCEYLKNNKLLIYIGKQSFNIMTFQYILFYIYDALSSKFLHISVRRYENTVKAFILSILTIILICALTKLSKVLENKFNFIYHLRQWFGIR